MQNLSAGNLQFPYQSWHRHQEPGNWGEPQTVQHKHHPQQQSQEHQLHKLPQVKNVDQSIDRDTKDTPDEIRKELISFLRFIKSFI